jgi:hypothetical protein
MGRTLYLLETRARNNYVCPACGQLIPKGELHFRHDPYPYARAYRGEKITHWCRLCILASAKSTKDSITRRLWVPALEVMSRDNTLIGIEPLRVELIGIGRILSDKLAIEPSLVHLLSPEQFEEFICFRLDAMGMEPRRLGSQDPCSLIAN